MEKTQGKTGAGFRAFPSPVGDAKRGKFVWNEDHTELVQVGEVDIQKEIDERARGMTMKEQIERAIRGDYSVFQEGEAFYGDVSDLPESDIEALNEGVRATSALEAAALEKGKTLDELEKELRDVQKELELAKKQQASNTEAAATQEVKE